MKSLSRREALTAGAAALTLLPTAAMAATPAQAAEQTSPDPLVELKRREISAEKRLGRIQDQRDELEHAARRAGLKVQTPFMKVGFYHCCSVQEVERVAKEIGLNPGRIEELANAYRDRLARQHQQRIAAGLGPVDAEYMTAHEEWERAMEAIATVPATTIAGLAVKIHYLVKDLEMGESEFCEDLCRTALADARRVAGRAQA